MLTHVLALVCCSAANLTISSPLEAHKSHNIVFSIVGLDCGFDNAIFAAIELDYSDADQVRTCRCTGPHCSPIWPPPCDRCALSPQGEAVMLCTGNAASQHRMRSWQTVSA
jgi:hypothetical protein